jgi:O-antigen ligase
VIVLVALGLWRGGDSQMAKVQVQNFVMLLLMVYLAAMSLRDIRDYRTLGKVIVVAACVRAVYALYVVMTYVPPDGGPLQYASSHGDSLVFATAMVLLIVRYLEQPSWRFGVWCAMLLPLLAAGMVANNRRLVWVQVAAGLLMFAILSRRSRVKRLLARLFLLSLPLIAAYVAVGWNSQSKVFAPVRIFRSVGDGQVDSSTLYRDLENYNLLMTLRLNPMMGTGFGQPFMEVVTLPDISFFREYRYMPHNSVLGLWAYTGAVGFTGISLVLVVGIYLASRSYRLARSADERTAALMVIAVVCIYAVHCWGDIGFSERRTMLLVGPALAIAGQLACATGAWRSRASATAPKSRS